SAGQLIVITAALGLIGGFLIWFGEEEARPLLRYGGAASLVGAIALILMAGPAHLPPGPPDRVMADVPALRPSPSDSPSAAGATRTAKKTTPSASTASSPLPTHVAFFPRGVPPPEPPPGPDPHPTPSPTPP